MVRTGRAIWRTLAVCLLLILLWLIAMIGAGLTGFGRLQIDEPGSAAFVAASRRMLADHKGNLAMVLIEDGRVAGSYAMSAGAPVSEETLFQVASVSKWVAAWGVMTLVEAGRIDLDAPVSRYLTRWQLPPSTHDTDQVTVRRLLSHTAGLTDDLGYCGFATGVPVETLEASLTQAADACPLRTGRVAVGDAPGGWRYSGGGYTLLQLIIEEVSGERFADYMQRAVLMPLGMTRSTYRTGAEGVTGLATFYDSDGSVAPHNHYTAAAAASLYTSANDLARFAQAHLLGDDGVPVGRGVLSPKSVAAMRAPAATMLGEPHWGLGPRLYAASAKGGTIFGHDGGNVPAISTTIRIDSATGDAIVALGSGGDLPAAQLGAAWMQQRRGPLTMLDVASTAQRIFQVPRLIGWFAGGVLIILIGGIISHRRARRRLH
jgi:CubicO group peptidase (beta-lactamase class C family)